MRPSTIRLGQQAARSAAQRSGSAAKPRHLFSISDLTPTEFATLVRNAASHKKAYKSKTPPAHLTSSLLRKSIAMVFNKRSTRTRVSTESAVNMMGGHPMFLGKDDIQLGVNESTYDTSVVLSSMTSCIVARLGAHSEITDLAAASSVPVINALTADFHPLQAIADFLTITEAHPSSSKTDLGLGGLKVAWVGDSNNVAVDLASACLLTGMDIAVASPKGYGFANHLTPIIESCGKHSGSVGKFTTTHSPEEAIKDADIIVTDTWISMGQEEESKLRLKAFEGYQITEELAKRGGAKENWNFMHCLPRHAEEVSDEVFYGDRSLVFPEAENRLWAAISALEGFVVNKGNIKISGDN